MLETSVRILAVRPTHCILSSIVEKIRKHLGIAALIRIETMYLISSKKWVSIAEG